MSEFISVAPGLLGMFSDFFGLAIIAPLLPSRVNAQMVGFIISGQYLAVVIGSVVLGVIADFAGGNRALAITMICDAILFAGSAFVDSAFALLALRCCVGFFAPQGLAIAWIGSVSTPKTLPRNMGLIAAFIHLGILSGTICGGLLSWYTACIISAFPPLITLLFLFYASYHPAKDLQSQSTQQQQQIEASPSSRRVAFRDGVRTRDFAAVAMVMFANGAEISLHFALFVVVLTSKPYNLSRFHYSLSLFPASFIQMFNHFFLLPKLIRLTSDPFIIMCLISIFLALFFTLILFIILIIPSSPWPILIAQCIPFWAMSFLQGISNFASTTQAHYIAPQVKSALIGAGRASFNLGTAIAPSLLLALYLNFNLYLALATISFLYILAALSCYWAILGDPSLRPPAYSPPSVQSNEVQSSRSKNENLNYDMVKIRESFPSSSSFLNDTLTTSVTID
uniref:Major facilitator superfamily (MFS) profile domain-containing protein n=1 Tax=Aureoumbra lagunensis TaxID=44058 RepID=A0A7S3NQ17_9STRA